MEPSTHRLHEHADLAERVGIFNDRNHAGRLLADMLSGYRDTPCLVLGVPSGGVPVAAPVARALGAPLDVAVANKITPPWNTEYGYGAIAFDGTVVVESGAQARLGLSDADVRQGYETARQKVARNLKALRGERPMPEVGGRTVILVDDGIATGYTLRAAIDAIAKLGPGSLVVAIPTAHRESIGTVQHRVDAVYCPNVRSGFSFAVAEAYKRWRDVTTEEAAEVLREFWGA